MSKDGNDISVPFKPTISKVANVLDALRAVCNLPTFYAAPCWLDGCAGPDPSEIGVCSNGLLHIPTRRLLPSTPRFFSLNGLGFTVRPARGSTKTWMRFLTKSGRMISGIREGQLQEWIGYLLTPVTRMQKMLILIGPKHAGKGTIGRVIRMLLGEGNVCTPTLAGMAEPFGLASLIGKPAAIISDARISGRARHDGRNREVVVHIRGGHPDGAAQVPARLDRDTPHKIHVNDKRAPEGLRGCLRHACLAFHHSGFDRIVLRP